MCRTILCVFSTRTICVNARDCWMEAFIISKSNKLRWTLCSETGRSSLKDQEKNIHSFKSLQVRESKTVLDSRFHTLDAGFLVLASSLCQRNFGFWITRDSWFLKLHSRFQSPGFQISQAEFYRIPDSSASQHFPDSGIPLHGRNQGPRLVGIITLYARHGSKLPPYTYHFCTPQSDE